MPQIPSEPHLPDSNHEDSIHDSLEEEMESQAVDETEFFTSPTVEYTVGKFNGRGLLGLMCPGAYWILRGKFSVGILLNTVLTALILIGSLVCLFLKIFPVPMSLFIIILTLVFWVYGSIKSIFSPRTELAPIPVKSLVAISFMTFWLPFILCLYISTDFIFQRTWMSNDTMLPGIKHGDVILVDKLSYKFSDVTYGDLVLVEEKLEDKGTTRQRSYFGRIIARGGDEIQLIGVHPSVNRQKLSQYYQKPSADNPKPSDVAYEIPINVSVPADIQDEPERWYPVLAPQQVLFTQTNQVKLDADCYYVLEDNRVYNQNDVNKRFGAIIHETQLKGFPRFVLYNTESKSRFERYGITLK